MTGYHQILQQAAIWSIYVLQGQIMIGNDGPADAISSQRRDAKWVFVARFVILSFSKVIYILAGIVVVESSALHMINIKLGVSTPFRAFSANTRAAPTIG
jgi:hypothetical protein